MMGLGAPRPIPKTAIKKIGGKDPDYETLTPLFREMIICRWLAIDHSAFLKKNLTDKLKWILFERMERERENYFAKKQEAEIKKQQVEAKNKMARTKVRK